MNIRRRLENLERKQGMDDDYLVLAGPHDANRDEALARWMLETGKPRPQMFIYLKRFSDACTTVTEITG